MTEINDGHSMRQICGEALFQKLDACRQDYATLRCPAHLRLARLEPQDVVRFAWHSQLLKIAAMVVLSLLLFALWQSAHHRSLSKPLRSFRSGHLPGLASLEMSLMTPRRPSEMVSMSDVGRIGVVAWSQYGTVRFNLKRAVALHEITDFYPWFTEIQRIPEIGDQLRRS